MKHEQEFTERGEGASRTAERAPCGAVYAGTGSARPHVDRLRLLDELNCERLGLSVSDPNEGRRFFAYTLEFQCPFLPILPYARAWIPPAICSVTVNRAGRVCSLQNKYTSI
ncbi:hypothetical protein EVAR_26092_1 [Eumeta japonica]|uniref:Uncharacterized protein n=1 Tax=Eumeta variegata TaxID=151549 RepID=A0A4C1WXN6_EUMVA|nr:hypothetical protein EVAR_26092_1 [Eumeta japonica]